MIVFHLNRIDVNFNGSIHAEFVSDCKIFKPIIYGNNFFHLKLSVNP
jgi:hypothetical protein